MGVEKRKTHESDPDEYRAEVPCFVFEELPQVEQACEEEEGYAQGTNGEGGRISINYYASIAIAAGVREIGVDVASWWWGCHCGGDGQIERQLYLTRTWNS